MAMSGYIQSVEIDGTVYVGGGYTDRDGDDHRVMAYSIRSRQWHSLPPYSATRFAMTTIDRKLVLVGGLENNSASSKLGEWHFIDKQWTHPFPSMLKPHSEPSATSYKHYLVVAGGGYQGDCLQDIEILDMCDMQWSNGPCTPIPWRRMKSITIGDTWYLMGGYCNDVGFSPDVYSVSLESLASQEMPESGAWKKLPSLNCTSSSPLTTGGTLLAVGGVEMESNKLMSTIQCYMAETNAWIPAAKLPQAVSNCNCIITLNEIYVMGGWNGNTRIKKSFSSIFL